MDQNKIQAAWRGQADCLNCGIRHLALFSDLTESDFNLIHRPVDELYLDPGRKLYGQGDEGTHVYTVRAGLIKLEYISTDGGRRIMRLLRRGDAAGLEAVVGEPYRHSAVVLEAAHVCRIPSEVVQRLNRDTPRLCQQLLERWQRSLDQSEKWLTALTSGPARSRVIRLIGELMEGSQDRDRFTLITREDMASILGISRESASRAVAELRRGGLIREMGDGYYQADISLLKQAD